MTNSIMVSMSETEFKDIVSDAINQAINDLSLPSKERQKSEYMTGKEVDEYLKISSVTRHKYAKKGVLIKHKPKGGRVMYRRDEVEKALKAIQKT